MDIPEMYVTTKYCCLENDCGKEYTTKINLKRHILTAHLQAKKFPCSICSKIFTTKQNLKEHMYLHNGVKPYNCDICCMRFRHMSSYSLHRKYHRLGLIQQIQHQYTAERETQTVD